MKKVGTAFLTTLFIFSSFTSANAEEKKKDNKAFIDVSLLQRYGQHLIH